MKKAKNKMKWKRIVLASLAMPSFATVAPLAFAADKNVSSDKLDEVVVTARRKEESLQSVPLAVSSISTLQLERAFLADSTALAQFAPNVVLDKVEAGTAGGAAFSIRGISYQDVEKAFDPTVLLFIDDVAIGTGTGNVMNMLDVDRVEVLRGPQGTLFGKNAVGGIVNVHRKEPKLNNVSGKIRGTVGNFNTQGLEGYFNFGGENYAVKLTAAESSHGGYYKNLTTGVHDDRRDESVYGIHLLWKPVDRLSLQIQNTHVEQDGTPNPVINISGSNDLFCWALGQCASDPKKGQAGNAQESVINSPQVLKFNTDLTIGKVSYDLNDQYQLTYIGGHMRSFDYTSFDFDGSPATLYVASKPSWYKQDSHEIRLTRNDPIFNWQTGIYLWDASSYSVNVAPSLVDRAWASSKSFSLYGEGDYRFASEYVLTAGFRYIEEKKKIGKYVDDGAGNASIPAGTEFSRKDDEMIWRLGVRRELTGGDMVYATYSTGFRSGGFSPRAASLFVLARGQEPEKLINYEVGAKTRWLDNRLQVNASLFHMIYDNMQIETNLPAPGGNGQQQGFDNVGRAMIDGIELDVLAKLDKSWTISGNLGLLHAKYDSFFTDLYGTGTAQDFTNLKLRRAPRVSAALSVNHRTPVSGGYVNSRVGYSWRSKYEGTLDNSAGTQVGPFGSLDASVAYERENWSIALFGRNLTNESAFSHTFSVVPTPTGGSLWKFATPRQPRTLGVQFTYEFDK